MAELRKKSEKEKREDQLTTADLAGRAETAPEHLAEKEGEKGEWSGPTLVRDNVNAEQADAPNQERSAPAEPRAMISTPLFSEADVHDLRDRWGNVQSEFVDEPRQAVEEADKLVATVMQRLAEGFANERSTLEQQWAQGSDVSTEDLRVALQRYRSFFDRLLAA